MPAQLHLVPPPPSTPRGSASHGVPGAVLATAAVAAEQADVAGAQNLVFAQRHSSRARRWSVRVGSAASRLTRPMRHRELLADERGAVTAEYAIVIMAAVAFAGLLVAIMRSSEIRAMLVQLVEDALGSAG